MRPWSLRTKLVVVAGLGLLPILAIAAWHSQNGVRESAERRAASMAAAVDLAVSRQRELIEGSRRMVTAVCTQQEVLHSVEPTATTAQIQRCEASLAGLLGKFPPQYSAIVVTDDQGVTRCSSSPSALGISLADREVFRRVRSNNSIAVGSSVASRITPHTVLPVAAPIIVDEEFRGMCAVGVSLTAFADFVTSVKPEGKIRLALVDSSGVTLGAAAADAALALPVARNVADAIASRQVNFSDYGQNGGLYEYRINALSEEALFIVAAAPIAEGLMPLWQNWNGLAATVLASAVLLSMIWFGVDRWCRRPLLYFEQVAARIARGEEVKVSPFASWGSELASVGTGIEAMAKALANRESELKSGLEQRDQMLREIHHRVKNNLQMISSLLNLQAGEIRSPRIRRYFGDAQNRVLTLSILHRHLYERSSWSLVDFQQFISDLVRQISVGRLGVDRPAPRFHIRAPIMAVGPDTAIPVGLIVTEAVGNALNHDFSGVNSPEIRIDAAEGSDHDVELVIEDNGRRTGRETMGADGRGGFGLTLVRGLAMQLGGEASISESQEGCLRLVVRFPMPVEQEVDA
jgi:two-component sensor histidine kinase